MAHLLFSFLSFLYVLGAFLIAGRSNETCCTAINLSEPRGLTNSRTAGEACSVKSFLLFPHPLRTPLLNFFVSAVKPA